jgi:hypothetical protein
MPERTEGVKAAGAELLLRPMSWLLGSMKNMGFAYGGQRLDQEHRTAFGQG